jgi:hypothetical protein
MQKQPTIAEIRNAYAVLHLLPSMPITIVPIVHRELVKMHHPDVGGNHSIMAEINAAFTLIETERLRQKRWSEALDRWRKRRRKRRPAQV